MYLIGSLLLAFGVSIFAVSKIAEMLHAKKPGMERVFIASLVGGIAAFATLVAISVFVKNIEPMILMVGSLLAMFIVSTIAFKSINQMSWSGAITTNIANVALVLMTTTAAVVLNGESIGKAIESVQNTFKTNTTIAESLASGNIDINAIQNELNEQANGDELAEEETLEDENLDPVFKEIDLLPPATVKELEAKKKIVYKEPKFRVISLSNARSAIGKSIRIKNANGNSIVGALKNVRGNDLVIEQRINGGLAVTPISLAKIKKLEVYR